MGEKSFRLNIRYASDILRSRAQDADQEYVVSSCCKAMLNAINKYERTGNTEAIKKFLWESCYNLAALSEAFDANTKHYDSLTKEPDSAEIKDFMKKAINIRYKTLTRTIEKNEDLHYALDLSLMERPIWVAVTEAAKDLKLTGIPSRPAYKLYTNPLPRELKSIFSREISEASIDRDEALLSYAFSTMLVSKINNEREAEPTNLSTFGFISTLRLMCVHLIASIESFSVEHAESFIADIPAWGLSNDKQMADALAQISKAISHISAFSGTSYLDVLDYLAEESGYIPLKSGFTEDFGGRDEYHPRNSIEEMSSPGAEKLRQSVSDFHRAVSDTLSGL